MVATEVRRSYAAKPRDVKMEHMKLEFHSRGRDTRPKITKEQADRYAKMKWLSAVGYVPPKEEEGQQGNGD